MACVCESREGLERFCVVCSEYVAATVDFTDDGDSSSEVCEECIRKALDKLVKRKGEKIFIVELADYEALWYGVVVGPDEKEVLQKLNTELPANIPAYREKRFYIAGSGTVQSVEDVAAKVRASVAKSGNRWSMYDDEVANESA